MKVGIKPFGFVVRVTVDARFVGKDVKERAHYLMSLPPVPELDLPEDIPNPGEPARRLLGKLEIV